MKVKRLSLALSLELHVKDLVRLVRKRLIC